MIGKADILARAAEWHLRVGVVEKDYVLGWMLAALASHPETSQQWVFKGGTCLKKCFFETYRFSEDLDFSLLPGALYTKDELQGILREVCRLAAEMSGLDLPGDSVVVRQRPNGTFEGKVTYRGPMADPSQPRIRFDLTKAEPVLDGVARQPIFHAYPDELPSGLTAATYSIDELFAEKLRALTERTRPRDLYDVVHVLENRPEMLNLDRSRGLFADKCSVKKIATPDAPGLMALVRSSEELRSEWQNMLAHQLPELPPLDAMLARLDGLFSWLDRPQAIPIAALPSVQGDAGQEIVSAAGLQYWGQGVGLEAVRFAGTNRLLVEFQYKGTMRRAEPYSLRRATGTGKLLLYAWEQGATHIKAFDVARISALRATSIPFTPQYRIDFSASGPIRVSSTAPSLRPAGLVKPVHTVSARSRLGSRGRGNTGPIYIYECSACGKKFRRSRMDAKLNPHKDRSGLPCFGRYGTYVDTKYR